MAIESLSLSPYLSCCCQCKEAHAGHQGLPMHPHGLMILLLGAVSCWHWADT